jgi:phage recombination protein Bet
MAKGEVAKLETKSLVMRLAQRYGVDPDKFLTTLKATAFKGDGKNEVSTEQLMALLIVAEQHNLNPWLKEIYAFPDSRGGIVPIVGIDGFIKIANDHPQYSGMTFEYDDEGQWVECIISRKDRGEPTRVREYLEECRRNTPAWSQYPRRMLRHRAMAQCIRIAFGFSGVMDQDEAEQYIEGSATEVRGKPRTVPPREIDLTPAVVTTEPLPDPVAEAAQESAVAIPKGKDPHLMLVKALDKSGVSLGALAEHFGIETCFEIGDIPVAVIPKALGWLKEVGGA